MDESKKNTLVIKVPQAVHSDYASYAKLLEIFNCYLNEESKRYDCICTNFRANTWFDANLLPVVFAFVYYGTKIFNIRSTYDNQKDCDVHKLMVRNQFAKHCYNRQVTKYHN